MRKDRFLFRLLSGAFVVTVVTGEMLLIDGVSDATPSVSAHQVMAFNTSTELATCPASSVAQGSPLTLIASVEPPTATGNIEFKDGETSLGTVLVSNGTASLSTENLSAGRHWLTAAFSDSTGLYSASTSHKVGFYVEAPATITIPFSSSNPQYPPPPLDTTVNVLLGINLSLG